MKRLFCVLLLCLLLPLAALAESHTVLYFYRNYCESCTPEEDFARQFQSLTGVSLESCDFTAWNVVRQDGQTALEQTLADLNLASASLPLAIVDGVVYQGAGEMNSALAQTSLTWQSSTDSSILYLYTPACESCAEAEAALNALPSQVELRRGEISFQSNVNIQRVDISRDPAFAQALFDAYEVEDSRRVTPAVFFGDHVLTGAKSISEQLSQAVQLGWAAGTLKRVGTESQAAPPSLMLSVGAGLVAGLNTCALSMLLLFLSLILPSGRRAPAVIFLGAKLVCYLLIGFALLQLFQQFNPHWLGTFSKWFMTVLGAILILLNLSDAFHAAKGDLGALRNQLPASLRGRLHRRIRSLAGSRMLLPASALLGFLVAGGEFMCAGQLYLMQLISFARYNAGQAVALIAYCLAFLLPSAAVCVLVFRTHSHLRASAFFADHLVLVKLITALAMLTLILVAWLI